METFPDPSTPGQQSEGRYLQSLLRALQQMRGGDFFVRMPGDSVRIEGKIADTFNEIVAVQKFHEEQIGHSARSTSLAMGGNRILVVEDEPLVAMNLSTSLAELGFHVVGPYSTLAKAAAAAAETEVDAALLDVNLSGKVVYPVAEILASKNVPFAFITGYGTAALPDKYANAPVLQKPIDNETLQLLLAQKHPSLAKLA